ncbi:MAG TPA: C25 family cysteine peptidase [Candidatus Fermentibacter daniensis]|nr:C25 family cysteine peptidase [Candidatus Fermentibacter daniensis]
MIPSFTVLFAALAMTVSSGPMQVPVSDPVALPAGIQGGIAVLPFGYTGIDEGYPDLPSYPEWVSIPAGVRATGIETVSAEWADVPGDWRIRPLPAPAVLSSTQSASAIPDPAVYGTNAFWPTEPVRLAGTGFRDGEPCAELIVTPLRYNPVTGMMQKLVSYEISVETAPTATARPRPPIGDRSPQRRMLIVTDEAIRPAFDSLASWRTSGGILTEVVTTEEIYSTQPGSDGQEKIRNLIIDRWTDRGLDFVLLGGDTGVVPCRYAFAMSYQTGGGRDDSLPCDLYFSDLDGTWNLDGDDRWGELADSVDLYADVSVGRAPVDTPDEAWNFVNRTISYENAAHADHLDDALLIASVMWENPYTDGGVLGDWLTDNCIPGFYDVTKQYESQGTYGEMEAVEAYNLGTHYSCIISHGWWSGVGPLSRESVDLIDSNGRMAGMIASSGCWTNAFDFDAVSEHFLNNPNGGSVCYIGNSSYGWGSPGNPLYGYSDLMNKELFRILFEEPTLSLGETVARAKDGFVPFGRQENVYRCIIYIVNLLGDPSLVTHRMAPVAPVISAPDIVTSNTRFIPVTIETGPIDPGVATVCIHGPGFSNYTVATPDASGHLIAELAAPPTGDMRVTVSGTAIRRTSIVLPFQTGPSLVIEDVAIDDTPGFGHLSPGNSADVQITLRNQGTVALTSVELDATLTEGPATITGSTISYGSLAPGASGDGSGALAIEVDEGASTGDIVRLAITLTSQQGSWSFDLPLLVYAPGLCISMCTIDDSAGGDGNGYAEAGESFDLLVDLANIGLLEATDVEAAVPAGPSWLSWTTSTGTVASIPAGGTGTVTFSGSLSASAPAIAVQNFLVEMTASPDWAGQDTLTLIVGNFGMSEDVESGSPGWTHSGAGDLWHVTASAGHSGTHSWHCGDPSGGGYGPSMDAVLRTPPVYLAPNAELTFWSRFDLALYGADGLYVIISNPSGTDRDTIDFIGSGGLLGSGSGRGRNDMQWLPRTYDLSGLREPGSEVRIEFSFHSDDSDEGPGFWLDDFTLNGCYTGSLGFGGGAIPRALSAGAPCPNPGRGSVEMFLAVPRSPWTASVFDTAGRLVLREAHEQPFCGTYSLDMSGMSAGVYFIRIESCGASVVRRAVLLD